MANNKKFLQEDVNNQVDSTLLSPLYRNSTVGNMASQQVSQDRLRDISALYGGNSQIAPNAQPTAQTTPATQLSQPGQVDGAYVSVEQQSSPFDDELSEMIRSRNYKALFNEVTQLANVRQLSQKYMQNNMRQSGLYGTGEGTTANTQLNNAYLNAQANAVSNYYDNEGEITADAYTRNQENNYGEWQNLMAIASQNGNVQETMDQIIANNPDMSESDRQRLETLATAYSNMNSEDANKVGSFVNSLTNALNQGFTADEIQAMYDNWVEQGYLNGMSDVAMQELERTINDYKAMSNKNASGNASGDSFGTWLSDNGINANNVHSDKDSLKKAVSGNRKLSDFVDNEINTLFEYAEGKNINGNTIFKLQNASGKSDETVYVVYDGNGGFYVVNEQQALDLQNNHGAKAKIIKGMGNKPQDTTL